MNTSAPVVAILLNNSLSHAFFNEAMSVANRALMELMFTQAVNHSTAVPTDTSSRYAFTFKRKSDWHKWSDKWEPSRFNTKSQFVSEDLIYKCQLFAKDLKLDTFRIDDDNGKAICVAIGPAPREVLDTFIPN